MSKKLFCTNLEFFPYLYPEANILIFFSKCNFLDIGSASGLRDPNEFDFSGILEFKIN